MTRKAFATRQRCDTKTREISGVFVRNIKKVVKELKKHDEVIIGCHVNPDGDTIGSMLALGLAFESMGKKVHMLSQDGVPGRYRFLSGAGRVRKSYGKPVSLAVSVDCGSKKILGSVAAAFDRADRVIEIDHHECRVPFGDLRLIDTNAACVGEIIYKVIKQMRVKVTKEIAESILTSVIVETNSFRLPNVTASAFSLCAELMGKGVDFYRLVDRVYWSKTREIIVLSGICFSRCRFLKQGRLVWSIIKKDDFKRIRGKDEDVDAVADEMRAVSEVEIVALFRENSHGNLRVSLRSKKGKNVAVVAEMFGGGGHPDVAGCTIPNNKKHIDTLLRALSRLLQ